MGVINFYNVMGILFTVAVFTLGASSALLYQDYTTHLLTEKKVNGSCGNSDISSVAYCLKNNLSEFYKYNISQKGKQLTLEELKEQGGVCSHYAEWYADNAKKLGFYAKEVSFDTGDETAHEIAIISDETGYCLLDQLNDKCYIF